MFLPRTLGSSRYVKHANNGWTKPRLERDSTRTGYKASPSSVWWLSLSWHFFRMEHPAEYYDNERDQDRLSYDMDTVI